MVVSVDHMDYGPLLLLLLPTLTDVAEVVVVVFLADIDQTTLSSSSSW
jgi:hypothetical protein